MLPCARYLAFNDKKVAKIFPRIFQSTKFLHKSLEAARRIFVLIPTKDNLMPTEQILRHRRSWRCQLFHVWVWARLIDLACWHLFDAIDVHKISIEQTEVNPTLCTSFRRRRSSRHPYSSATAHSYFLRRHLTNNQNDPYLCRPSRPCHHREWIICIHHLNGSIADPPRALW